MYASFGPETKVGYSFLFLFSIFNNDDNCFVDQVAKCDAVVPYEEHGYCERAVSWASH